MKPLFGLPQAEQITAIATRKQRKAIGEFWIALWVAYVRNKGTTSLPYWAEKVGCPRVFNATLYILAPYIITEVIPQRNWGEVRLNENTLLQRFDQQTLVEYRRDSKYSSYTPKFVVNTEDDLVRVGGAVQRTGLVREGFAQASTTQYYYDTEMLRKYQDGVVRNTVKGMRKVREMFDFPIDEASYDSIAADIVENIAANPQLYTQEGHVSDSRGRSIKRSLKRVANPIGYKDFRALLTIPLN